MTARQELQGIFYTQSPTPGEGWLYTVRDAVKGPEHAKEKCRELARRFKRPASVRIEDWNHPRSDADGFAFECDENGKAAT